MAVRTGRTTVEEFEQFVMRPENAERLFEWIEGEIVEVVSNSRSSEIAMLIGSLIVAYVRKNGLGRVTGADGGYVVSGDRVIPDVAFISKAKQPEPSREAYNPIPPDLAVEVLSPSNDPAVMRRKVVNYLRAGTTVWIVDPDRKRIEVYAPDQAPQMLGIEHTLDGGNVLPGFSLPVKDIFTE